LLSQDNTCEYHQEAQQVVHHLPTVTVALHHDIWNNVFITQPPHHHQKVQVQAQPHHTTNTSTELHQLEMASIQAA
jgi:hypothetical protein